MASGDREITDLEAKQIERILALPDGWMDREHLAMFGMSRVDYDIYSTISAKSERLSSDFWDFLPMAAKYT
jgi:hypothetical protein